MNTSHIYKGAHTITPYLTIRGCKEAIEFYKKVFGAKERVETNREMDIRNYAKYILKEGTTDEKRLLLGNLRTRIVYEDKRLTLQQLDSQDVNTQLVRQNH